MTEISQERKKSFSSFTYKEAFKQLGVTELGRWMLSAEPVPISDFFRQRLERLQRLAQVKLISSPNDRLSLKWLNMPVPLEMRTD